MYGIPYTPDRKSTEKSREKSPERSPTRAANAFPLQVRKTLCLEFHMSLVKQTRSVNGLFLACISSWARLVRRSNTWCRMQCSTKSDGKLKMRWYQLTCHMKSRYNSCLYPTHLFPPPPLTPHNFDSAVGRHTFYVFWSTCHVYTNLIK